MQEALSTVSRALTPLKEQKTITWLLDSGFDDVAVWRTIWEAQEHLVYRVYHQERLVSFQDRQGQWQQGNVEQARGQMRPLARVQTTLVAKRGKQPHGKPAASRSGGSRLPAPRELFDSGEMQAAR